MPRILFIVAALMSFVDAKAQNINIQPSSPNDESLISIITAYSCDINTESMTHSINGFVIEFDIEVDYILNNPLCMVDPPPPLTYTYPIGQLPAGDYEFILNTTFLFDNSVSQRSFFITVGPAPAQVPLNSSLLIFLVLGFSFIWFRKSS
ncbi:hypothetical protein [Marinicella rhabdoformis]|uniref:hypothetical protein n=1 Tax=Marinicella rhabdoformis TaxID=2580566 RepID=UPI0012AEBDE3|nr:hypothetical protein [Marinicella rhabdoformis]